MSTESQTSETTTVEVFRSAKAVAEQAIKRVPPERRPKMKNFATDALVAHAKWTCAQERRKSGRGAKSRRASVENL